jgi:GDP-4-dehydro-6-deoxy-D-mannose reductase
MTVGILITGATGFSGKHLTNALPKGKILLSREIEKFHITSDEVIKCDLLNVEAVNEVINDNKPNQIYHLAGSFTNDYDNDFSLNVTATRNILEAVKNFSGTSRVLLIGSASEYGLITNKQCPVSESSPLRPNNIYGLTKIYQKYLMDYYVNEYSLDIVMARPFNLYGKDISPKLFIGKVYEEITKLKNGITSEISLGNLDSERDYISIEEAIEHYIKIMNCGVKGEIYNVGHGEPTKIRDMLKKILEEEGVDIGVVNSNILRIQANDSDQIYADISKLRGLYND